MESMDHFSYMLQDIHFNDKTGMMKKYLPLSQSQHLNEIFQNK